MFARASENPNATIYVIIYEGREARYNKRLHKMEMALPRIGTAEAKFRSIKTYASIRGFPVSRINFIKGGFREDLTVEIWLVPVGSQPPTPTPSVTKMRYIKGKPHGFCTDCC